MNILFDRLLTYGLINLHLRDGDQPLYKDESFFRVCVRCASICADVPTPTSL